MEETAPNALETRPQFLARLRLTTRWMNEHWRADALHLATNQKERARQVLDLHGQKCEWWARVVCRSGPYGSTERGRPPRDRAKDCCKIVGTVGTI